MSDPVEFLASIPPTATAMQAHGLDGFRLVLDIPDSEAPAYIRLLLCRGHVLKVRVEIEDTQRAPTRKRKATREKIIDDDATEDRDRYFAG